MEDSEILPLFSPKPHYVPRIPLDEIMDSTNNFDESAILGSGGFGTVYRGTNNDGTIWAIKRTTKIDEDSLKDFEHEVKLHFFLFGLNLEFCH